MFPDPETNKYIIIGSGTSTVLHGSIIISQSKAKLIYDTCLSFENTEFLLDNSFSDIENLKIYNEDNSQLCYFYLRNNLSLGFVEKSKFEIEGVHINIDNNSYYSSTTDDIPSGWETIELKNKDTSKDYDYIFLLSAPSLDNIFTDSNLNFNDNPNINCIIKVKDVYNNIVYSTKLGENENINSTLIINTDTNQFTLRDLQNYNSSNTSITDINFFDVKLNGNNIFTGYNYFSLSNDNNSNSNSSGNNHTENTIEIFDLNSSFDNGDFYLEIYPESSILNVGGNVDGTKGFISIYTYQYENDQWNNIDGTGLNDDYDYRDQIINIWSHWIDEWNNSNPIKFELNYISEEGITFISNLYFIDGFFKYDQIFDLNNSYFDNGDFLKIKPSSNDNILNVGGNDDGTKGFISRYTYQYENDQWNYIDASGLNNGYDYRDQTTSVWSHWIDAWNNSNPLKFELNYISEEGISFISNLYFIDGQFSYYSHFSSNIYDSNNEIIKIFFDQTGQFIDSPTFNFNTLSRPSLMWNTTSNSYNGLIYINDNNDSVITDTDSSIYKHVVTFDFINSDISSDISNSNIAIGYNTATNLNGNNNILIGNELNFDQPMSNKLMISNNDTSTPLIEGDFSTNKLGFNSDVGIGTTNPSYNLDVQGDIRFTGYLYDSNGLFSGGASSLNELSDSFSSNYNLFLGVVPSNISGSKNTAVGRSSIQVIILVERMLLLDMLH